MKTITLKEYQSMGHEAAVAAILGDEMRDYDLNNNNNNLRGIECEAHTTVADNGAEMSDITEASGKLDPWHLLAMEEIDGGFWVDGINEDTALEDAGKFNVDTCSHWSAVTAKSEGQTLGEFRQVVRKQTAQATGARSEMIRKLDSEGFKAHVARQAKARACFGLDLPANKRGKVDKVARANRKLARLENKAKFQAMLEANKAKWSK